MFYEKAVFRLNPSIVTITDGVGYNSAGEVVTFDQAAAETEAEDDRILDCLDSCDRSVLAGSFDSNEL